MKLIKFPEKLNNFTILAILMLYAVAAVVLGYFAIQNKEIVTATSYAEHVENEKGYFNFIKISNRLAKEENVEGNPLTNRYYITGYVRGTSEIKVDLFRASYSVSYVDGKAYYFSTLDSFSHTNSFVMASNSKGADLEAFTSIIHFYNDVEDENGGTTKEEYVYRFTEPMLTFDKKEKITNLEDVKDIFLLNFIPKKKTGKTDYYFNLDFRSKVENYEFDVQGFVKTDKGEIFTTVGLYHFEGNYYGEDIINAHVLENEYITEVTHPKTLYFKVKHYDKISKETNYYLFEIPFPADFYQEESE
ncbi:MAG TPA: hypothetical protein PKK80_00160 [Bacilli bacterium]|jgi:hypothetical protein|nr:hypothetical protein [Bacilli bacterium]HOC97429.1 hypothetical protein [Bacilli bacterium]HPV54932.1 hypothetical protein [Bacilli bacterium]HQM17823.1 hypothetical protein [Bacilli bacterium]